MKQDKNIELGDLVQIINCIAPGYKDMVGTVNYIYPGGYIAVKFRGMNDAGFLTQAVKLIARSGEYLDEFPDILNI